MVKKIALFSLIAAGAIVVLTLILFPFLAPGILERNSKDWIGRRASLEKMRLNYFTGTIRLYDFNLYEKDDSTVFVGFDTLIVDTEPYQLFSKTFVVEQFYLQGLFVDVIMYDSAFNFDDLIAQDSTAAAEEEPEDPNSDPFKFEISDMELRDAVFIVQDAEIQDSVEIDDFHFFLPYLVWDQETQSEADLEFVFKNEGFFRSIIDYNPGSQEFLVNFTLGNYDISGYRDFVGKYMDVGDFEGIIDLGVQMKGNMEQPIQTSVSGNFQLSDFALFDTRDSLMIGTSLLSIDLEDANFDKKQVIIDTILLLHPTLYFEAYDSTSNIAEFMNRAMPPQDTVQQSGVQEAPADSTQQFYISLNAFVLDSGKVRLADYTHDRAFEYDISSIRITSDSITSDTEWLDADIKMNLSDRGKLDSRLMVNLANPEERTLDLTISSLMLEDFDVYCREATGYPLMYGDMYLKSHMEVIDDTLKSQNDIVIHNIKLGKREQLIGPPLKFAMFLLKDKDKVVHIDMPVEGPVDESGANVPKMFWDQFSGLLVKVVDTPFKFIGAVFNVFDTDIKRIKYDYLDSTFTDKKERQLNTLLKIEDHDEEVKIDLVYYKDSLLERQQIAMELVHQNFGGRRAKRMQNDERFKKYVERQIKTDTLSVEEACLLLADRAEVDAISASYDSARFRSLRNYLYSQRDTTSITLYYSRESAPNNEDNSPRFEVKLGMKDDFIEEKYTDNEQ